MVVHLVKLSSFYGSRKYTSVRANSQGQERLLEFYLQVAQLPKMEQRSAQDFQVLSKYRISEQFIPRPPQLVSN
jgi:hypothetical protein